MQPTPISVTPILATRPFDRLQAHGLITLEVMIPGFVQRETMTHKRFARNWASSRAMSTQRHGALGFYCPTTFYRRGEGMSVGEPMSPDETILARSIWIDAWEQAYAMAEQLTAMGVAKDQANRLLNDAKMMRGVITATEAAWSAFLQLRHVWGVDTAMYEFAGKVAEAIEGLDWSIDGLHVPYADWGAHDEFTQCLDAAAARIARVSYERPRSGKNDLELAAMLKTNGHLSPFEHIARWDQRPLTSALCCKDDDRFHGMGWTNYRATIEWKETDLPTWA